MSRQKTAIAPSFKKGVKPPSGNEGRLHTGLVHPGYYGPNSVRARRKAEEEAEAEAEKEAGE